MLERLQELIIKLKKENSILMKEAILRQYEDCKKILYWVYNPMKQFYVTSKNILKNKELEYYSPNNLFDLLYLLSQRELTGHAAIGAINTIIKERYPNYEDLIYKIIDKDLECRIGIKMINKVWPGLIPEFSVSLANKYKDFAHRINWNDEWYISRKLDGVRVITIIEDKNIRFFSRNGKEYEVFDTLKKEIKKLDLDNIVLDGEVCIIDENGNENFSDIVSLIRRKNYTIENPKYLLFDTVTLEEFYLKESENNFKERYNLLNKIIPKNNKYLSIVKHEIIKNEKELEKMMVESREKKWEGLMLRKNDKYKAKRSNDLLKVKEFYDAEYKIIGFETGPFSIVTEKGSEKIETLTAVHIEHKGNLVKVGSGFSLEERKEYFNNPSLILNRIIKVQYFEESIDKEGNFSLRFPIKKHIFRH